MSGHTVYTSKQGPSRFQRLPGLSSSLSPYWQQRLISAAAKRSKKRPLQSRSKPEHRGKPGGGFGSLSSGGGSSSPATKPATIFPLPEDVRRGDQLPWTTCGNFSLALQRLLPYQDENFSQIDKKNLWRDLVTLADRLRNKGSARHGWDRQQALIDTLNDVSGLEVWASPAETKARLSVGFGNTTPLETGLTLHRLYGVPYLPGTALKGLCRSWALEELAAKYRIPRLQPLEIKNLHDSKPKKLTPLELLEKLVLFPGVGKDARTLQKELKKIQAEMQKTWQDVQGKGYPEPALNSNQKSVFDVWEAEESCQYRQIFGSQECRGEVCFYDAFPKVDKQLFQLDIINVHYQPYYGSEGQEPPADYYSPVPNYFLTVAPEVTFQLLLTSLDRELLDKAAAWLTEALATFGLGAKTALGYGEMAVA